MLADHARINPRMEPREEGPAADVPTFTVFASGRPGGVLFRYVPGGHEFTSLVLAVLNSAGLGRFPRRLGEGPRRGAEGAYPATPVRGDRDRRPLPDFRPGIYAAGDVTTVPFKQIVIAMGEGAKAALSAFEDRMRSG